MLIGENWKVEGIPLNVMLSKKRIVSYIPGKTRGRAPKLEDMGKEVWDVVGYFSTVQSALIGMVRHEIIDTELKDFKTIADKQNELENLIRNLSSDVLNVAPTTRHKE